MFASWLSTEANEANHIKRDSPVMVVMGNPPYSGISSNKGDWITELLEDYKYTAGIHFNERKHWLGNDYVKFIRFGQYFIEKNGEGILAYITPHSFLADPTFRSMRWNLLKAFDEIYTLDLHGHSEKKETAPDGSKDENVFDITQGVTITIFVKTGKKKPKELGKVFHSEQYGLRNKKYEFLLNNSLKTILYKQLPAESPNFYFSPKNFANNEIYEAGFQLDALFPNNVTGIVTMGDSFIIADTKQELKARLENFKANEITISDLKSQFALGKNYADWVIQNKSKIVLDDNKYVRISYRPFDTKWTYFDNKLIWRWRSETMKHMLSNDNFGIATARSNKSSNCDHFMVSNCTTEAKFAESTTQSAFFPLYIYPDSNDLLADSSRTPNLNMQIVNTIAEGLRLTFTAEKTNQANTFAPIDLLDYIYAVLHSPTYRETYKEFLKIDFPRVPYPRDTSQFWQLVALGGELRQLHLLEGASINQLITSYPESGNNLVDKPRYDDGKVYINDTQYFEGVPKLAWEFYIGGYQPAQKWLKDRKGRTLSFEDNLHYQKIIKALVETDRLMQAIDDIAILND